MTAPEPAPLEASPRAAPGGRWGIWITLIVLGLSLRVAMMLLTIGTNDAMTWAQFGHFVNQWGLYTVVKTNSYLNHPPLPVYWSVIAYRTAVPSAHWADEQFLFRDPAIEAVPTSALNDKGEPIDGRKSFKHFSAVFRVPAVLADLFTCLLLYRLWRGRAGPTAAAAVAAGFAWSLCAILVSGFHTNTDSVLAFFCLLAVYLIHDRGKWFLGGLALAAAINVKLTPVLLVPVLLLSCRSPRQALAMLGALAIGAIPFVPVLAIAGEKYYTQALAYRGNPDNWGVLYLLMLATGGPPVDRGEVTVSPAAAVQWYYNYGKFVLLAAVGVLALAGRWLTRRHRLDRYDLAALTISLFLVLAPGFGAQYTVAVLPLLFASRPRWANVYGLIAGLFLLLVYGHHWTGDWPIYSKFVGRAPLAVSLIGLAAWATLAGYVVTVWVKRRAAFTR